VHGPNKEPEPDTLAGILGVIIIAGLFTGGYELALALWKARPLGYIATQPSNGDFGAKDAQVAQLMQQLAAARMAAKPEPRGQPSPLDIRCQHLADCPSVELSKRADELAAKLEKLTSPYEETRTRLIAESQTIPRGTPEFDNAQQRMSQSLKAHTISAMSEYRHCCQIDVIAMRKALSDRIQEHNTKEDAEYESAGTQQGSVFDLERIADDLRNLAGKVRAMRQHE
jgi:hypothetical protein